MNAVRLDARDAGRDATRLAWLIALTLTMLRLYYVTRTQLAPDEAYYWEWSRSLDWCYYDQGPMLALAIRFGTWLCGVQELGVRLPAVLSGLLISGFYIWLARRLRKPELAPWLVLAANGMLLFSVGAVLMMHDSLLGAWWCLGLYAALRAHEEDGRFWLLAGLACGFGCLSKYSGLFLPLGLLLLCAWHRDWRRHLKQGWLWAGAALGGIVAGGPILYWNRAQGWPSFGHVGSLAGGDLHRHSLATFPEFLGSQLGLVTPVLCVILVAALVQAARLRRGLDPVRALLATVAALPLAFFTVLSLRTRVEGNWPAPAYLSLLPLGALWLWERGSLWGRASRWALGVAFALTAVAMTQAAWPFLPFPAERVQKLDTTLRLAGWRELAERVQSEREALGPRAFVGARTYQNAAELSFYLPGHGRTTVLQRGVINHQYRFWNHPENELGKDAVLVVGQPWEVDEMRDMFQSLTPLADAVFTRNGLECRRTRLYVGRHFTGIPQ